ncbi:sigma-54-dependent transcriptional regulator [Senegalia massiliensis]|uniref:Stage 0 sporulation protein A homolog n=1 Tax=Senegalia massiliensis TaxID=1720316 RepID=A0A845R0T5_9CLOT|nr:sigma-54 dependent transcriptional regulator [Senegalia massiliensis]NBI07098.1 sigma-54-dependent Fis family transcriptional regulator [Senegalia massiliensis]
MYKILLVDDEESFLKIYKKILKKSGYETITASNGLQALEVLEKESISLIISDIVMPKMDGITLLKKVKNKYKNIPVLLLTGKGTIESAVNAMKVGACTYLSKPINIDELLMEIDKYLKYESLQAENKYLKEKILEGQDEFLGTSEVIKSIKEKVKLITSTNSTVLITGESGTGKELVADLIYRNSLRKDKVFVKVNCAVLSKTVLESELFGHEKGAFTGAINERKGRFEAANKGTIFLDEIGEMPLNMQAKLLRVIQEKEFERVGSNKTIKTDFRLISATNKDLKKEVDNKNFREDLYYRLNVISIHVPPLRERKQDILVLFDYFVKKFVKEMNKNINGISERVKELLIEYKWPGNVRELKNIAERLVVFTQGHIIEDTYLPKEFFEKLSYEESNKLFTLKEARMQFEKEFIENALNKNKGNISRTANDIGLARKNLYQKIERYKISKKFN